MEYKNRCIAQTIRPIFGDIAEFLAIFLASIDLKNGLCYYVKAVHGRYTFHGLAFFIIMVVKKGRGVSNDR